MPEYNAYSSGDRESESIGPSLVASYVKDGKRNSNAPYLLEFGHSHPLEITSHHTSNKDLYHKDYMLKAFPKAEFKLFYDNGLGYKSRSYKEDSNNNKTGER